MKLSEVDAILDIKFMEEFSEKFDEYMDKVADAVIDTASIIILAFMIMLDVNEVEINDKLVDFVDSSWLKETEKGFRIEIPEDKKEELRELLGR